jgi:hypothetical protein
MSDTKVKNPPLAKIRVGSVQIAIWENTDEDGKKTISGGKPKRTFRDKEGQYHETSTYFAGDYLELAKAADLAHTRILELQALGD